MMANPMIEMVRSRASPRSFLLSCKCVLVAIRSVEGCQEKSGRCIEGRIRQLAAGQFPGRSGGKRSVGTVAKKEIIAPVTTDRLKREDCLTECAVGLRHPEPNCRPGQYRRGTAHSVTAFSKDPVIFGITDRLGQEQTNERCILGQELILNCLVRHLQVEVEHSYNCRCQHH